MEGLALNNLFNLKGKVAVITGASGGIGSFFSIELAQQGVKIVLNGRNEKKLEQLVTEINNTGGNALAVVGDVTKEDDAEKILKACLDRFGTVDILVNCAGIILRIPTEEFPLEKWEQVMDINVKGTFLMCKIIGGEMIKKKSGRIINIGSVRGGFGYRGGYSAYCPSKGAIHLLTKTLAVEWAKHGILVNCIAPTFVKTELTQEVLSNEQFYQELINAIPLGRIATPEDLVGPLVFFSSAASTFVTGQILYVDGGVTAE
ncbi:MAG: hypothetical protein JL56_10655 [Desulfotomaculum sp. BICA1-6]|nr:MAG: hypothetical protein JL56_10655 [Desulfotomaculum sp. BICA1-6]